MFGHSASAASTASVGALSSWEKCDSLFPFVSTAASSSVYPADGAANASTGLSQSMAKLMPMLPLADAARDKMSSEDVSRYISDRFTSSSSSSSAWPSSHSNKLSGVTMDQASRAIRTLYCNFFNSKGRSVSNKDIETYFGGLAKESIAVALESKISNEGKAVETDASRVLMRAITISYKDYSRMTPLLDRIPDQTMQLDNVRGLAIGRMCEFPLGKGDVSKFNMPTYNSRMTCYVKYVPQIDALVFYRYGGHCKITGIVDESMTLQNVQSAQGSKDTNYFSSAVVSNDDILKIVDLGMLDNLVNTTSATNLSESSIREKDLKIGINLKIDLLSSDHFFVHVGPKQVSTSTLSA